VLSIAFGASEPLVDGNVQRVFARLFAIEAPLGSRALVERAWILAGELVPRAGDGLDPGAWNQALMELGARVCTARSPACPLCPVRRSCRARAGGRTEELPLARARRAPHPVELEILVPRERGRYLVVRRPEGGRMAGLFEFPTRELVPPGTAPRLWPREHPTPAAAEERELGQVQHTITHHRIRARVFAARASTRPLPRAARWCRVEELRALALTGLARKVLALATAEAPR
jgi:A/G-specific adenine glycosylase